MELDWELKLKVLTEISHFHAISMQTSSYLWVGDISLPTLTALSHVNHVHCHLFFALFLLQREDPDGEPPRLLALLLHSSK